MTFDCEILIQNPRPESIRQTIQISVHLAPQLWKKTADQQPWYYVGQIHYSPLWETIIYIQKGYTPTCTYKSLLIQMIHDVKAFSVRMHWWATIIWGQKYTTARCTLWHVSYNRHVLVYVWNEACHNKVFYHDVGEICWHQPITSLKLGHVTGQGSMSPTWVGRVSDPGKNSFCKKGKNLDNIAVHLITSLKSKWKVNK